ncbi:MAG: hypothetical protein JXB10_07310 [Pirellulales bacterium]|nr:hypothetical protein [Pirellulales bacterium]
MQPRIIGPHPLATDDRGRLLARIGTVLPYENAVITLPGIHATQRSAYLDQLDEQRGTSGLGPLDEEERSAVWRSAVDLIMNDGVILIRPDPENMALCFAADELLQTMVPKTQIHFLNALDTRVRNAIKRRGESWRITPLPKTVAEMKAMIAASRIGIGHREIYYYSQSTGTRLLTGQEFARLRALGDEDLRSHLTEIRRYCTCRNGLDYPEIDFFLADPTFRDALTGVDFSALDPPALRSAHAELLLKLSATVRPELRQDDVENPEWRWRMFVALVPHGEDVVSEEALLGLGTEFYMQIQWLPGGRIEQGELIFDEVLDEARSETGRCEPAFRSDDKARGFIFNLVREYGDVEYVNVGRVVTPLARRRVAGGRRGVYVVELKRRGEAGQILKILRMQRWGVREHLDEGKPLLRAIMESEEYTEYILDRRLACRQLGMNLPHRLTACKIGESYHGRQECYHGARIWTPYFERDYIRGMATDMVPRCRFENPDFALRFAELLGRAAAPNLIVCRRDLDGTVIFDDGDEVLIEDENGLPVDLVVSESTGAFDDYTTPLHHFAPDYAAPVNKRTALLPEPAKFAEAYLGALIVHFDRIQQEYRKRRRAFDTLFKHRFHDEGGSLAYRWELVLKRLERTDLGRLEQALRDNFA